jgi:hypothetical protein
VADAKVMVRIRGRDYVYLSLSELIVGLEAVGRYGEADKVRRMRDARLQRLRRRLHKNSTFHGPFPRRFVERAGRW